MATTRWVASTSTKPGSCQLARMRAALPPLDAPPSIVAKDGRIVVVTPIGKSGVERAKEAKRLIGVHAPHRRYETKFWRERLPDLVNVMLPQAIYTFAEELEYTFAKICAAKSPTKMLLLLPSRGR